MMDYISSNQLDRDNSHYSLKMANFKDMKRSYLEGFTDLTTYPVKVTLQTTEKCNLQCKMCPIQRPIDGLLDMDVKLFRKIAQEVFPYLIELHPTNIGEPLYSRWFIELCSEMRKYGVLLDLTTNATMLNEKVIRVFLPILADVKISVDGFKADTFESIRKGARYQDVINKTKLIVKLRNQLQLPNNPTVTLQMTIMRSNFTELPKVIELAKNIGADRVNAYHIFSFSKDMDSESVINKEYDQVHAEAISAGKRVGIVTEIAEPSIGYEKCKLRQRPCHLLWAESFIDVNGSVYPCHSHGGDSAGALLNQSLKDIWNSRFYQELRSSVADRNPIWHCAGCGMNVEKLDENQPVPYDFNNFKTKRAYNSNEIRWSSRMKQFDIIRPDRGQN